MGKGKEPTLGSRLSIVGAAITAAYVVSIAIYMTCMWHEVMLIKPSDAANALSGVFAPIAFLWLVLGFLQQGIELRHSAQALYLQQEELRNSVEQQQALVEVTREQVQMERLAKIQAEMEAERISRPILILSQDGSSISMGTKKFHFDLKNLGPTCTNINVTIKPKMQEFSHPSLVTHEELHFTIIYDDSEEISSNEVTINYITSAGKPGSDTYTIVGLPVDGKINSFQGVIKDPWMPHHHWAALQAVHNRE